MKESILSESEMAFTEIVWANAPIPSGELVKLCEKELGGENLLLTRCCEICNSIYQETEIN